MIWNFLDIFLAVLVLAAVTAVNVWFVTSLFDLNHITPPSPDASTPKEGSST